MNFTDKETIKVNILLDNGRLMTNKNEEIENTYSGLSWDIWDTVKPNLEKKYKFKINFTPEKEWRPNHNKTVIDISNGVYDLVVGPYMHTIERNKAVNFTEPIAIDGAAIIHSKMNTVTDRFFMILYPFLKAIIALVLFGIVLGLILHIVDPIRAWYLPQIKKNNSKRKYFIFRSVMTGIASVFGEMGFLTENTSLSVTKILTVTLIMIFATFVFQFVQAEVTVNNIESREKRSINKNNITMHNPYMGFKNAAPVTQLEKMSAKVEYLPKMNTEEAINRYKKESDKYGGYITTIALGLEFVNKDKDLKLAYGDFGYEPISFIVNKNKNKFLKDLNHEILNIKYSSKLEKICRSYFPESWGDHHICSLK